MSIKLYQYQRPNPNSFLSLAEKSRNILTTHLQDVNECCLLTEKALSHENETEILFVKKQVGERLEDYAKMDVSAALTQIDDSLE